MVRVWHEAVGIRHYPFALRVAAGGGIDGWDRDIDAVAVEARLLRETAEIEAVAAAGIENYVVRIRRE